MFKRGDFCRRISLKNILVNGMILYSAASFLTTSCGRHHRSNLSLQALPPAPPTYTVVEKSSSGKYALAIKGGDLVFLSSLDLEDPLVTSRDVVGFSITGKLEREQYPDFLRALPSGSYVFSATNGVHVVGDGLFSYSVYDSEGNLLASGSRLQREADGRINAPDKVRDHDALAALITQTNGFLRLVLFTQ
jgi:hypothetical protein